jgi:cytochrome c oxidase subunit 2
MVARTLDWRILSLVAALIAVACSPQPPQGAERAPLLFQTCASCHGQDGGGRKEYEAPAIAGLESWYVRAQLEKFQKGIRGAHPDDVAGLRMRPMSRTLRGADDVALIADYVASLPPRASAPALTGDAEHGKSLFVTCSQCHGGDARGNRDKHAPPLYRASDWYLVAQLKKFKAGIRGTHPADVTGSQMRPMALGLADERAMRDVVAYIDSLSD